MCTKKYRSASVSSYAKFLLVFLKTQLLVTFHLSWYFHNGFQRNESVNPPIPRSAATDPCQISCHIFLCHISNVTYAADIFINISGVIITSRFLEGVACTDEDDKLKSGIESWVLHIIS